MEKNHLVKLNETLKKDRSWGPEENSPDDFFPYIVCGDL